MASESGKLFPFNNSGLFSEYYLSNILKEQEDWKTDVSKMVQRLTELYDSQKKELPLLNENSLEDNFIRPILKELGYILEPQPSLPPAMEGTKKPDLALFPDSASRKTALPYQGKEKFFKLTSAICEVKRWGRPLDKKLTTEADPFEVQNPSLQISRYLWLSGVKWGILTDGRFWRLYERESSKHIDVYYEIDLPDLLENGDVERFKYFALLFRKEAIPGFLTKIQQGSIDYAKEVGQDLKKNIYAALKLLAEGLFKNPENHLDASKLDFIGAQSLIYLYRLLFILYAEDRNLLPVENGLYRGTYSLRSLREEIQTKWDNPAERLKLSPIMFGHWERLHTLFKVINEGSAAHGIPQAQMYVPPYNGGLFDPNKNKALEQWRVGDSYLAQVIDLLSRSLVKKDSGKVFVSYRDLAIRDLGSIYEGLLEYKLNLTPAKALELVTDKGERKATGSYYTQDYIVSYIVENTLGPLVKQKKEIIIKKVRELQEKVKTARGYTRDAFAKEIRNTEGRLVDEILSLKILDPAIGSGHFLVEATNYLARALVEALSESSLLAASKIEEVKEPAAPYKKDLDEEDIRWARREVIEKCIYGVDLNPLAVELAKLSLWLSTVAQDKPLSFLDHHLRCGNSLIGARVKDLATLPKLSKRKSKAEKAEEAGQLTTFAMIFNETVNLLLKDFELIESVPSETVEQIKEKEKLYQDFRQRVRRFEDVADIWTSVYFGNKVDWPEYQRLHEKLRAQDTEWKTLTDKPWFKAGLDISRNYRFFHWELEFPEAFYDGAREKKHPGFDAVIGNPPYDVVSEKEQQKDVDFEKSYLIGSPVFSAASGNKLNLYRLFVALATNLLRQGGQNGFIVPMSLLADSQSKSLRENILKNDRLRMVEAFPQKDDPRDRVFADAKLSTCVYVLEKSTPESFRIRVHPGKDIRNDSNSITINPKDIRQLDPDNLSIPCYPKMTAADFALALKLVSVSGGTRLGDFAPSQQGEVNLTTHAAFLSDKAVGPIVLRGAHVDRYILNENPKQGEPKYLRVKEFLGQFGPGAKAFDYRHSRVGYQRGSAIDNWKRIIATVIESGNFCSDTINYIVNPKDINLSAVLGLLNSSLWEWRFRLTSTNNHVNSYEIDTMPLRPIAFTTEKKERDALFEKARSLYDRCTAKNDLLCVTSFVDHCLKQKPEQADVVHDLLAFLAEQMIEMNKEKQVETKGFLEWLESAIGAKVDDLKNKTKIRAYHDGSLDDLLEVLKENSKALKKNPGSKDFYDVLKDAFQKTVAKLSPFKSKLAITDRLIDLIVYRLYGLTEEEIMVVERS